MVSAEFIEDPQSAENNQKKREKERQETMDINFPPASGEEVQKAITEAELLGFKEGVKVRRKSEINEEVGNFEGFNYDKRGAWQGNTYPIKANFSGNVSCFKLGELEIIKE